MTTADCDPVVTASFIFLRCCFRSFSEFTLEACDFFVEYEIHSEPLSVVNDSN